MRTARRSWCTVAGFVLALLLIWWLGGFVALPPLQDAQIWTTLAGALCFFVIGLADDLFALPPLPRLAGQLLVQAGVWKEAEALHADAVRAIDPARLAPEQLAAELQILRTESELLSHELSLALSHGALAASVSTPSRTRRSAYSSLTGRFLPMAAYISGWVKLGSSLSLWPKRL